MASPRSTSSKEEANPWRDLEAELEAEGSPKESSEASSSSSRPGQGTTANNTSSPSDEEDYYGKLGTLNAVMNDYR